MSRMERRAVLRGLGGVLLSLPCLEGCTSLDGRPSAPSRELSVGRRSAGLDTPRAKRFIALMCPDGVEPELWFPDGNERGFKLNTQNAALEAVREHLIITSGIDNRVALDGLQRGAGNGHAEGVASLLTGWAPEEVPASSNNWVAKGGPSIDQILSDFHEESGYVGRSRGIHLGDESPGSYSAISLRENGDREDYTWNTDVLFDSPADQSNLAMELARQRRKSVLDGAKQDFEALVKRISGEDKRRIEAHLDALRSIEKRYSAVIACTDPNLPEALDDDQRRDLIQDIIVAAMACDATRVATVVFRHSGGGGPQLPFIDVFEDIHELSHQIVGSPADDPSHGYFTKYHTWWSGKTVRFVNRLKETTTADGGSLFDDTVLFQGSEISFNHGTSNMPFLILAGANTPFSTGRYVRFPDGTMHTHLLTTLLQAFGHTLDHVGDPEYASGHLNTALFKAGTT